MTFTQVRKRLNKIPCINSGGCGVAALALLRWRRDHGYTTGIIVFLDDDGENESNREALLTGNLDYLRVPSHIMLQVNSKLYDTTGINPPYVRLFEDKLSGVPENILIHLLNKSYGWNDMFDRETYIPEIESLLDVDLSDIEREI